MVEQDFKDLKKRKRTVLDIFNIAMAKKTQEFAKLRKPFDEPCARIDFRDKVEAVQKESQRMVGFVDEDMNIEVGDLDKYGKEDRFDLLEDQEDYVDRVMEGSRTQVVVGHTLTYKCKNRGHKISVFIPIKEYNEMKATPKKKKEE